MKYFCLTETQQLTAQNGPVRTMFEAQNAPHFKAKASVENASVN